MNTSTYRQCAIDTFKIYTSFGTPISASGKWCIARIISLRRCHLIRCKISFAIWIIWFGQCVQKAVSQVWPLICRSWRKHEEKSKFSTRFNDCGKFMLLSGPKPNEHWTFTFECTRCSSHWFNWNWHCRKPFWNTIVYVAHSV